MGRFGLAELGIILAILVLLFGAKKLPALADGMGKAIRNFKRGLDSDDEDVTPADKQVAESSSAAELEVTEAQTADQKG
ncbi:MAG: twin-arginine translocase TatA/TatE family subunit [Myxococcales bacterium]|nr:twin-arginine translocase TatA/TatE family subunit [Myxococcales bacterium]